MSFALLAVLVMSLLVVAAWYLSREPLGAVPRQLLGRWQPLPPEQAGVFLQIDGGALEWSAGPGRVERRELLGVRELEQPADGEAYALHFVEDGEIEVLRLELGAGGRARVGGRQSVEWSRVAASP